MARPITSKNLDVAGTSRDSESGGAKGVRGELVSTPHLYSLCASPAQPHREPKYARRQYRVGGTKYITVPQATNIIEAVQFAKSIGLPLVAHLTIHWAYTNAADDADGKLFAKFREGLSKWLHRHGIVFAAAWARQSIASLIGMVADTGLTKLSSSTSGRTPTASILSRVGDGRFGRNSDSAKSIVACRASFTVSGVALPKTRRARWQRSERGAA